MADLIAAYLPDGVATTSAVLLVAVAGGTSALTAAVGIGGGLVLLATMAVFVPASALVPVHAVVQLGSNAGRSVLLARRVEGKKLAWFVPGAALGVTVGGLLAIEVPAAALRVGIALFVLYSAWGQVRLPVRGERAAIFAGGALSSGLTMFVGATGPFVLALFRQASLAKEPLVATTAVAMTLQHGLKLLAFGVLGFAFGPWIPLLVAMIGAGFAGTWIGTRLLRQIPEATFRRVLRWVLTAVAVELLVTVAMEVGTGPAE